MLLKFTTSLASNRGVFRRGRVIDSAQLPADQVKAWMRSGILVPVEEPAEEPAPIREAVADGGRQAVTRRGRGRPRKNLWG